ncbi:hypothetical protein J7643_13640 [bacterium]|nr:hypothetical protein [bacterium]
MADDLSRLDTARLNPESNADNPQRVGIATLMDAVEGVRFPIKKDRLIAQKGDETIDLTGDRPEKLRVMLLRVDDDEFLSVTDLVQKIEHAL